MRPAEWCTPRNKCPSELAGVRVAVMKLLQGITVLVAALAASAPLRAQVVTPVELSDPKAQHLQQRHLKTLMAIGAEIEAHKFPYPFYFSRVLDVDLPKMQLADQRSIRFDTYKGSNRAGDHRQLLCGLFCGPHGFLRAIEGNVPAGNHAVAASRGAALSG